MNVVIWLGLTKQEGIIVVVVDLVVVAAHHHDDSCQHGTEPEQTWNIGLLILGREHHRVSSCLVLSCLVLSRLVQFYAQQALLFAELGPFGGVGTRPRPALEG